MSLCINPNCPKPNNSDQNLFCQCCGSELLISGRYRIIKLLSDKGGFGNTYEAIDSHYKPKVVKILTNNHPKAIELFKKEADVLTQLNHPGIPKGEGELTYFPRDSKTPLHCLVMEKIEGMDLEEYQKKRNNQPIDQALAIEWLLQLANILNEVHSHNFFHRDIKPSNIILRADGQLTLIDFGAVRQVTATILGGGQNTGIFTPGFAPPEQEKGYAVQQSDFFALGRTFIYLLTGKNPTDPDIYDRYNNELHWEKYAPNLTPNLTNFINYLVAEKATQRPPDSTTLLREITQIDQQLHPSHRYENPYQKKQEIPATIVNPNLQNQGAIVIYAGFWKRCAAAIIDNLLVFMVIGITGGIVSAMLSDMGIIYNSDVDPILGGLIGGTTVFGQITGIIMAFVIVIDPSNMNSESKFLTGGFFIGIIIKWAYYIIFECSKAQGTPGKKMVGLKVTNTHGERVSFGQANIRYWTKILSSIIIYFGYFCAGWTEKKRALHDMLSDTLVIQK